MENKEVDKSNEVVSVKKPMTEEERLKLAEKFDKDLDDFIAGLEKRSYTEGWPEDRWQEEMEKHPFFMTKAPNPEEELSPLMQGIQNLKYDTKENSPEELASTYKEDGNFNFKCKKYRHAIICYTEGIKQKCSDENLNAQLFNNRSASHFYLKNYRSCLNDCMCALRLKPEYTKTKCRAAHCYFHIGQYDKCIEFCESILAGNLADKEVVELKKKAIEERRTAQWRDRKKAAEERKLGQKNEVLLEEVRKRGIHFLGCEREKLTMEQLEPTFREVVKQPVHLQEGRLVWPVMFIYPEHRTTDFIQEFHEDSLFSEHLQDMFNEGASWDTEGKYNAAAKFSIYYEDQAGKPRSVPADSTLGLVLSNDDYRVDQGTPAFLIFITNSSAEHKYLEDS